MLGMDTVTNITVGCEPSLVKSAYRNVAFCGLARKALPHFGTPQLLALILPSFLLLREKP